MADPSPIPFVEACYALDGSLQDWVRRLAERAPLPSEDGWVAHAFEVTEGPLRMRAVHLQGAPTLLQAAAEIERLAPQLGLSVADPSTPILGTLSERTDLVDPAAHDALFRKATGGAFRDMSGVICRDGTPRGFGVFRLLRERSRPNARQRKLWTLLAAHATAGLRLRDALAATEEREDELEAVLTPAGFLEHAEGPARTRSAQQALRQAVQRIDRARSGKANPSEALRVWRGLVAGRWSLVDRYESDGRRFVVARRNDPDVGDPRGLTRRESQVSTLVGLGRANSAIAYALGVTPAAVSARIRSAVTKLGLGGRAELAALFAPGAARERVTLLGVGGEHLHVLSSAGLDAEALEPLSEAERSIALDLVRGATTKHLAEERGTSERTVSNQAAAIYRKLGVDSRVALAAKLSRRGDEEPSLGED